MAAARALAVAALAAALTACAFTPGAPAQRVALGSRLLLAEPVAGTPVRFQGGRRVAAVERWDRPYCILRGTPASDYRVVAFRLDDVPTGRVVTRFIDAGAQGMFGGEIVEYRSRLSLRAANGGEATLTCATREERQFGSHLTREEMRGILGDSVRLLREPGWG